MLFLDELSTKPPGPHRGWSQELLSLWTHVQGCALGDRVLNLKFMGDAGPGWYIKQGLQTTADGGQVVYTAHACTPTGTERHPGPL